MSMLKFIAVVCLLHYTAPPAPGETVPPTFAPPAPPTSMSAQAPPAFYNVRDYGATGDGKTLDNRSIDRAIRACAGDGGGTVWIPSGIYLCGSIHLASHVHLEIGAGAVLKGAPQDSAAYDPEEPFPGKAYQDGSHTYFHNSLIWGENLVDVSITGQGMIDGGGLVSFDKETGEGPIGKGDKAIALKSCSRVLIRDITIYHGGHFAILVTGCDLLTLDNLTIDTNRDGIDLDGCTNSMVSNCRINSPNDDALCPKSSYALGRPVITENLSIVNCGVSGFKEGTLLDGTRVPAKAGWSCGRIKFGTESNGGFRNCVVSNCTFNHCNGLALELVDGGVLENISISNITMTDVVHYPVYITLGTRNRGPEGTVTGRVRNVLISNLIATGIDSMSGIQITGVPGHPVEGIHLQNIVLEYKGGGTKAQGQRIFPELDRGYPEPSLLGVNPAYGLFARHFRDLELSHITIRAEKEDFRPAIICLDGEGLRIDHCMMKEIPGVPLSRFTDVSGVVIESSPFKN